MPATTLSFGKILSSHFRSLLWVAAMVSFAIFLLMVAEVTKVDFLNINPHRSQSHAASLPFILGLFFSIPSTLGMFIAFSISQIAQAMISSYSIQRFLVMLSLQSFVTIFSILRLRFEIGVHNLAKKRLLLAAFGFASIVGVAAGMLKTQPNVSAQSPNPSINTDAAR